MRKYVKPVTFHVRKWNNSGMNRSVRKWFGWHYLHRLHRREKFINSKRFNNVQFFSKKA